MQYLHYLTDFKTV